MNVVFLSPAFPAEMPLFARGLAAVGARVLGVGDQPLAAMAEETRQALSDYLPVRSILDERSQADELYAALVRLFRR